MKQVNIDGLVSVIVASYNHAKYLEKRMESLLNQSYKNIEFIVIDDNSTDNSLEILKIYENKDEIKLISNKKNTGWVSVYNQGFDLARGEYILFSNCDDDCNLKMIEILVEGLNNNKYAGISYCRSILIDKNGDNVGDDYLIREKSFQIRCRNDTIIKKDEMNFYLLYSCVIPNLSAALFRYKALKTTKGFSNEYIVCSDWELYFKIIDNYEIFYIANPLNYFRQHNTTIRNTTKERIVYEEYIRLLLGRLAISKLTYLQRSKIRLRIMYLWSSHLLMPTITGLVNFKFHLYSVCKHDFIALFFLPIGIILRLLKIVIIITSKVKIHI
jgi:glycosyltransferase involved in cell wall biosynthesis